jgi:hypothetical protein
MILQSLIGPRKSSYDVPSGTIQGQNHINEKHPLEMVANSCCHI